MTILAPVPITPEHDVSGFSCGHETLDLWLRRRAVSNQETGASRTYVVTDGARVLAFYALASGALAAGEATGRSRRNMPDPVPVVVLARLAVDHSVHGRGLGRALFRDAALKVISASGVLGLRGMIAHAVSDEAAAFYAALGLSAMAAEPRTLMVTVDQLRAAL